jgi:hypothetical protein
MPPSSLAVKAVPNPYFDDSRWPLVFVTGPAVVTMATVDEYNAAVKACLARRKEFVMVSDARATREMGALERKATADFERQNFDELHRWMKALALVFSTRMMWGLATAVSWLSTPPYPKKCFLDTAEAEAWARSKLTKPVR